MSSEQENKEAYVLGVEVGLRAAIQALIFSAERGGTDANVAAIVSIYAESLEKHVDAFLAHLSVSFTGLEKAKGGDQ